MSTSASNVCVLVSMSPGNNQTEMNDNRSPSTDQSLPPWYVGQFEKLYKFVLKSDVASCSKRGLRGDNSKKKQQVSTFQGTILFL